MAAKHHDIVAPGEGFPVGPRAIAVHLLDAQAISDIDVTATAITMQDRIGDLVRRLCVEQRPPTAAATKTEEACDIDPDSARFAPFFVGSVDAVRSATFDVVLAN